jgi:hypothetical protein
LEHIGTNIEILFIKMKDSEKRVTAAIEISPAGTALAHTEALQSWPEAKIYGFRIGPFLNPFLLFHL